MYKNFSRFFLFVIIFINTSLFAMEDQEEDEEPFRILMIEPGSMHGVAFASVLKDLEKAVGRPSAQIFDLVSGGSTGGLIALGVAHGYTAKKLMNLYCELGALVFNEENLKNPEKAGNSLDRVMQEIFGEKRMSEAKVPVLVQAYDATRATQFDAEHSNVGMFSCDREQLYQQRLNLLEVVELSSIAAQNDSENWDCMVWSAARANCTLPIFTKAQIKFPNGRIESNLIDTQKMPVEGAIHMAKHYFPKRPIELYVIGGPYSDLNMIKHFGKTPEREELAPHVRDLLSSLDKVNMIFSLTFHVKGSQEDASDTLLKKNITRAEKFVKESPVFSEVVKHLSDCGK